MQIEVVFGDITRLELDAIVNAANTSLLGGGGVDGAIHRATGPQLLEECRKFNGCKTGEAVITGAYRLPCKYVIHTPGPVWHEGKRNEAALLADCYRNSLARAAEKELRTIAFPCISTGIYGYPQEEAAEIAIKTVQNWEENFPEKVVFCCFSREDEFIYKELLSTIE